VPAEQIRAPGEVVPRHREIARGFTDPEAAWDFLTERSPYMSGEELRGPIDALKAGVIDAVIAVGCSLLNALR
jgi:hypothetical protein